MLVKYKKSSFINGLLSQSALTSSDTESYWKVSYIKYISGQLKNNQKQKKFYQRMFLDYYKNQTNMYL